MQKIKPLKPREKDFLAFYTNPKSEGFNNMTKSAKLAGYYKNTGTKLVNSNPAIVEYLKNDFRNNMLTEAENVLKESLKWNEKYLKLDSAKFIAKTLGKKVGYSEKLDVDFNGNIDIKVVNYKKAT